MKNSNQYISKTPIFYLRFCCYFRYYGFFTYGQYTFIYISLSLPHRDLYKEWPMSIFVFLAKEKKRYFLLQWTVTKSFFFKGSHKMYHFVFCNCFVFKGQVAVSYMLTLQCRQKVLLPPLKHNISELCGINYVKDKNLFFCTKSHVWIRVLQIWDRVTKTVTDNI